MAKQRVKSTDQKMALNMNIQKKVKMMNIQIKNQKMTLHSNSGSEDGDFTPKKKAQGDYDMEKTEFGTSFDLCTKKL